MQFTNWKTVKDLVIKAELSPETEEIVYQKVTLFGYLKTSRVSISNLEHLTLYDIYG